MAIPKQVVVHQEDLAENIHTPHSDAVMTLSVVGVIMAAIFITAVLRWLTKRMRMKKHYHQVIQEIARQESQSPPESPQTPTISTTTTTTTTLPSPPVTNPLPGIRNLVLPSMHEFFFGPVTCLPNEVVYQSLPDGSQVVFIPRGKLPSYEAAVLSQKDGDSGDGRSPSPSSPAGASCTSGYASRCSSETSLPPCYTVDHVRHFSERSRSSSSENHQSADVTEPLTGCSEGNTSRPNATIQLPSWSAEYPPPEYSG